MKVTLKFDPSPQDALKEAEKLIDRGADCTVSEPDIFDALLVQAAERGASLTFVVDGEELTPVEAVQRRTEGLQEYVASVCEAYIDQPED